MALGIAGYNCKIEYIQGKANTCADLLSRPVNLENLMEGSDQIEPDISNNTLEIGHINSNRFGPKALTHFEQVPEDRQHPEKECMGFDIVTDLNKDEDIYNIKQQLIKGTASSAIENKHIIFDDKLYFISNPIDQQTLRLVVPK